MGCSSSGKKKHLCLQAAKTAATAITVAAVLAQANLVTNAGEREVLRILAEDVAADVAAIATAAATFGADLVIHEEGELPDVCLLPSGELA
jgi:hypothetical protein